MKYNVVFPDEMDQSSILIFPIRLPSSRIIRSLEQSFWWRRYTQSAHQTRHTTFPFASGRGTGTPQSRSRVTARGCNPDRASFTLTEDIIFPVFSWPRIHWSSHSFWNLSKGKYQCLVFFRTGGFSAELRMWINEVAGTQTFPHFSHWSP